MNRTTTSEDVGAFVYDLHHELDSINLEVVDKVMKLQCFQKPKAHYDWDFVNDIGIINLLRREYFRSGRLEPVFDLYQSTRFDPRCHRYESLFALLVITIVGTVVGGVIVEHYKDYKDKLTGWVKGLLAESRWFGSKATEPLALERLAENRARAVLLGKFCDSTAKAVLADFEVLVKCFTARLMLDEGLISNAEYQHLVTTFLGAEGAVALDERLTQKYAEYYRVSQARQDAIRTEKVALTVDAYSKGVLSSKLDAVHLQITPPSNMDTADVFRGMPASPGAARGTAHVFPQARPRITGNVVLVVDAREFSPNHIDMLRESALAVTTNCGMTGHIPLICRGYGKGCVILNATDFSQIRNGDAIIACGSTGIVATGLMARKVGADVG